MPKKIKDKLDQVLDEWGDFVTNNDITEEDVYNFLQKYQIDIDYSAGIMLGKVCWVESYKYLNQQNVKVLLDCGADSRLVDSTDVGLDLDLKIGLDSIFRSYGS